MANIRRHGERWQARVRRKGHPEQSHSFHKRSDAEQWARQVENEMDRGVFTPRSEAEKTTLADLIKRYRREVVPHHKGSEIDEVRLGKLVETKLASYSVVAITPTRIAQYRDTRLEHVTSGTVLRELQLLSALFNHARKEWGIAVDNPVSGIRKPTANRSRSRRLEPEEEVRLLNALEPAPRDDKGRYKGGRNTWIKPLVQFALETAMRRGELLSLRWKNVNLQRRIAHLPDTKNGHARTVPLSSPAVAILETLPRAISGVVFPVTPNALRLSFSSATRRANLSDLRFHDLRHEATSRLATRLPNLVELAAVTGHRDLRMLARYYHPRPEELALKLA
jgi:integrase